MANLLRGDIYWADLEPVVGHEQGGQRPILILSHSTFNNRSGTVIGIALTSAEPRAGFPLTMKLEKTLLPKPTWVKISQIRTLSTQRLSSKITACHPTELEHVAQGLAQITGLS